jgi:hypothetical protein
MLNLTDKEKSIYNCYLKYSRLGQPYTPRKDFSNLDKNTIVFLKKISLFLSKYPHMKTEDYFKAPIAIHPQESYPNLAFFSTLGATKLYSIFKKQQEEEDPEKQIDEIKESLRFIGMFCLENNIPIEDYPRHKTGYMISWMNHYREHRVNPYALMEMKGIFDIMQSLPKDEIELFAKNLNEKLVAYKTRYLSSPKTKNLVIEATSKIKNFVKKNLQSPKIVLI